MWVERLGIVSATRAGAINASNPDILVQERQQSACLSVIVLADHYSTIRRLVEHLSRQTRALEIELVIGCPSAKALELPSELAALLACVKLVETPLLPVGPARAAAVLAASAPVIVLGESHVFPAPDWAERLLQAHGDGWETVAPGLRNANPESARSWTGFLMDYGTWIGELPQGEIAEPPWYNASWSRAALLRFGNELPRKLEPGARLIPLSGGSPSRCYHAANAKLAHLNVARPRGSWAEERYLGGRLFGAQRSRGWPLLRRLAYVCGSPLVPLICFVRTRPALRLVRAAQKLPRWTLLALAAGCVLWGIGEATGYLASEGNSAERMFEYELHKERYA